jgi:hypothetical protein
MAVVHIISDLFFQTTLLNDEPPPRFPPVVRVRWRNRIEIIEGCTHVGDLIAKLQTRRFPAHPTVWRGSVELGMEDKLMDDDVLDFGL